MAGVSGQIEIMQTVQNALMVLEHPARDLALREMRELKLKPGQEVFAPGDSCNTFLIVKSGSLRVSVMTETGREILLYRVEPGQSCVLTTACLMSGRDYEADCRAETDTEAIVLPKPVFEELLATSEKFRQFVFVSYGLRLHSLISLIQETAIRHIDRKLARLLVARSEKSVVLMTHQAVAEELNTAREVVSRLLSDFAHRGWVKLERGRIHLLDQKALEHFEAGV
jgi:CRP/FNR family transcriptional regulator, anaerobic regulatory protein